MKNNDLQKRILEQPDYWIEGINADLYDAILNFMDTNNMKQKDLASYLEISTGRVSQILNDGNINFSIDKIIRIALKIGLFPSFKFIDKKEFLEKKQAQNKLSTITSAV